MSTDCPKGRPDEEHSVPCLFLGKPALRKHRTRLSSSAAHRNEYSVYPSSGKSMADQLEESENISAEESLACHRDRYRQWLATLSKSA